MRFWVVVERFTNGKTSRVGDMGFAQEPQVTREQLKVFDVPLAWRKEGEETLPSLPRLKRTELVKVVILPQKATMRPELESVQTNANDCPVSENGDSDKGPCNEFNFGSSADVTPVLVKNCIDPLKRILRKQNRQGVTSCNKFLSGMCFTQRREDVNHVKDDYKLNKGQMLGNHNVFKSLLCYYI